MKQMFNYRQLLVIMVMFVGSLSARAGESHPTYRTDSIIIQKLNNDKRHTVNIYTNASNKVLFFSASGEEGRTYQLFLFREKGKLVKQAKIRNRETTVVSKPDKGNYYFEVFSDEIRIESGTILVL
ncbi:hypothetical protein ACFSQD_00330 [Flavihumibacter stibioxidans]|uniref:Por secretion system C-terminal sorting domain-containing protein n=1 Tax=Flavihumibacter stibioxidans TaxID=1834163 RepID=A0ABR7MDD1_9BACT|nr:hypothetical protein [Flavihumibacter stibioxidans]MBC6492947.1 hypothetical protein [Flavihumibacter stibioxidans]